MKRDAIQRSVWTVVDDTLVHPYVARCSHCGRYDQTLRKHWFFSGLYCFFCIYHLFYGCAKNPEEI